MTWVWLIPLLPLLGAVLTAVIGPRFIKQSHWLVIIGVAVAAILSLTLLSHVNNDADNKIDVTGYDWIQMGALKSLIQGAVDPLTAIMLITVSIVSLLVVIYSSGYMSGDRGYIRFFAFMGLFVFSMLMLVLADNFLMLYIFWEAVGLCSYLLIGFYYQRPSAAAAAKKAFLVNRVGDFGFAIGILLIYLNFETVNYTEVFAAVPAMAATNPGLITAIALCLFAGACGKSAQIPLYVWLPDAMEGPTPVSALIHAATMVTAGVYMVVRMSFIFSLSDIAMTVVATTGAVTALFAATIGFFQTDIKKVLAYSTVSQLGYMFLGAGVGAYAAAIFHLMTHAFFKACLFLCSGAVIAAMHHRQDVKDLGGLRKVLPVTFWTFLVSTAAIAGLPGLSGFFSKDEILWRTYDNANTLIPGEILWVMGFLAALCTAFYMVRLLMLTFYGECRADEHTLSHAKEHWVMSVPLIALAGLAIIGGYVGLPAWTHLPNLFAGWLDPVTGVADGRMQWASEMIHDGRAEAAGFALFHSHAGEIVLMVITVGLAAVSAFTAFRIYRKYRSPEEEAALYGPKLHRLLVNKYFVDELYQRFIIGPAMALFRGVMWLDKWIVDGLVNLSAFFMKIAAWISGSLDFRIVDGTVNGIGDATQAAARRVRRLQTGRIQQYVMGIVAGATVLVLVVYLF